MITKTTNPSESKNDSGAVIVCSHVASKNYPILLAERSEPEEAADTGWQFVCNSGLDENIESAQVWALDEIVALEPSLKQLLDQPPGTQLIRNDVNSPWQISKAF
jgi:hypothetical protein